MDLLVKGAAELDLRLTPGQVESFRVYHRELVTWNQRMNLTAIVDSEGAQVRHFLDSLTVARVLTDPVRDHGRMLDVGAGAGFPGLPLKLMFPGMHLSMLDSVGKKTSFLEHLVETLELEDVDIYNGRAEDLAMRPELRESFDVVVSRGVARMRVLMEYTLPYCRIGGIVVTLKKGGIEPEVSDALHAMEVLAGRIREMRGVTVDGLEDGRALVVVDKVKPTPAKFPRRPGLPTKRPL
ncbi:MAG: 16S rRNA (guanine(527)-N(7))-methyltransferase RsmG [Dehalococcoidia bacterium]|nr:16S rRNA (guanine(527)-N(7))-methyltransferase RsmG [Dehalococcoidia bacterium]